MNKIKEIIYCCAALQFVSNIWVYNDKEKFRYHAKKSKRFQIVLTFC